MHLLMKIFIALKMKIAPHLLMSIPIKATATDEFNNYGMSALAHAAHSSDAYNAANYYISFEHYLNTTQPIAYWITTIFGWISEMLYYIAKALIEIFVKLFDIFTITTSNPQINGIITDIKAFGTVVLILSFLLVLGSYVFHPTGGLNKLKTVGWNICIITLITCAVPYFVPKFADGIQSTAHALLQTRTSNTVQIPDHIVQTNVLDLPDVAVDSFTHNKGQLPDYVNHSAKNKIFVSTTDYSKNIPIKPFMINEAQMSQPQLDYWSGFNGTDAGTFLANVGSNTNNLNNDTLTDWKAKISKSIEIDKMKAQSKQLAKDKKKISKSSNIISKGINAIGYASDAEKAALSDIGSYLVNNDYLSIFGIKGSPAKFLSVFTYHVNGGGDDSTFQKFPQFDPNYGGGLFDVATHPLKSILGPAFQESYVRYSVNWFNIWLGLLFVIFAMSVYIFKLVKTWFKAVVMHVSAYVIIAKHIGNAEKVKEFIYNFFGLFEILLADVVTLYLMFVCYSLLNSELSIIIYSFKSAAFANPLTSALITFIADWALFQAGIGSIDAINSQIGGKANQAGHQESLLQTLTALKVTSMATKGAARAGGKALKPVGTLAGKSVKAGWNGMHNGGKDASRPLGNVADGNLGKNAKDSKTTDKKSDNKNNKDNANKQDKNGNKDTDGFNGNKKGNNKPDEPDNVKSNQDAMKDAKNNSDDQSFNEDMKDDDQNNDSDASQNNDDQNNDSDASQNNDDQNNDSDASQNNDDQNDDSDASQNNDDQNDDSDASQNNDDKNDDSDASQNNVGDNHNDSSDGGQNNGGDNHKGSSDGGQNNGGDNHKGSSDGGQNNGGDNHKGSSDGGQNNGGDNHNESSDGGQNNGGDNHNESSDSGQNDGGDNHNDSFNGGQNNSGDNHNESSDSGQNDGGDNHNDSFNGGQNNSGDNHSESSNGSQNNGGDNHSESSNGSQNNGGDNHSESSNGGISNKHNAPVNNDDKQNNNGNKFNNRKSDIKSSNNQFKDHIDFGDDNNKK